MLFNKCEQSNRKLIEDSNKDYKTKFDHKCTYIIDKLLTNYTYNDSL